MNKFPGKTIALSDTIDMYSRKLHINVRNGKVTLVSRWKDRNSDKEHTQRTTLNVNQLGELLGTLILASDMYTGTQFGELVKVVENTQRTLLKGDI